MQHPSTTPFSALMSVYIREQSGLLDKALRSILIEQTLKPTELILVEDGPLTEELYAVIEKYRLLFPAFKSVRLPQNQGLGIALNTGLEHCRYEWVARMDSDDISMPHRFETQLAYIDSHPETDVVGCALSEFDKDEHQVNAIKRCPEKIDSYIKFRSPLNHATVFFRKSSVQKAGGYQHCHFMEDYHLWIRMYAAGMTLTSIPESLYLCKMDPNTQKRRGGKRYVRSEATIQTLLLKKHIISLPRYCANIVIRCGARILPGGMRAFIYRLFLRNSALTKQAPLNQ